MRSWILRHATRVIVILILALFVGLGIRAFTAHRGLPLEPWHTYVPPDMNAAQIDHADWTQFIAAEDPRFRDVRAHVMQPLVAAGPSQTNRYVENGPIDPERFAQDWNRSYVLEPSGRPKGAVVLLHG